MKPTILAFAFLFVTVSSIFAKPLPTSAISQHSKSLQQTTVFESFTAHRQGDAAILNWIFSSEEVTSFVIERSYDFDPNERFFTPIAEVCPDAAHWNRYTDETVEPGIIYYRIVAYSNGVAIETSSVEEVKIVKHK